MIEKIFNTPLGDIHYWLSRQSTKERLTLVFLPGLTADHRLFEKQIEYFKDKYDLFVWDAPGHGLSRPFRLDFDLMEKAAMLHDILEKEGIRHFVLVGQSMGGYVSQAFLERYPKEAAGFVSIDSAPLQRCYMSWWEIALMKRTEPVYRVYPWKLLLKQGTEGVAVTEYGRRLMLDMMMTYDGRQREYAALAGHGYQMLANAMEADLPYEPHCPVLLICGEKDAAGSCKSYSRRWQRDTGYPLEWIPNAGHNSNTDRPDIVNRLIEEFIDKNGLNE